MRMLLFLIGVIVSYVVLPANAQFSGSDYAIFGGYEPSSGYNGRYFQSGDTVKLSGNFYATPELPPSGQRGPQQLDDVLVDVILQKPDGTTTPILKDYVPKNPGSFEAEIKIDDTFPVGKYDFSFSAHKKGQTSEPNEHQSPFYVARIKKFTIPVEGQEFFVQTESIEYEISNLIFDKESKSITFDVTKIPGQYASDDYLQFSNQIGVIIQRPLISPPFFVEVNGQEATLDPYMIKITDKQYSVEIGLYDVKDTATASITGTYVVPEFGSVSSLVLSVSLISVITIFTTKFRNIL